MALLTFVNHDATPVETHLIVNEPKHRLEQISAWYHCFYQDDDIEVYIDGQLETTDRNGEFEALKD